MHIVTIEGDVNPLLSMASFGEFQADIGSRCAGARSRPMPPSSVPTGSGPAGTREVAGPMLELRPNCEIVRHRSAAGVARGPHLHVRVHVLRPLRGRGPPQRLPQLRRRVRAPSHPAPPGLARGRRPDQPASRHRAAPPRLSARRGGPVRPVPPGHATRTALGPAARHRAEDRRPPPPRWPGQAPSTTRVPPPDRTGPPGSSAPGGPSRNGLGPDPSVPSASSTDPPSPARAERGPARGRWATRARPSGPSEGRRGRGGHPLVDRWGFGA